MLTSIFIFSLTNIQLGATSNDLVQFTIDQHCLHFSTCEIRCCFAGKHVLICIMLVVLSHTISIFCLVHKL